MKWHRLLLLGPVLFSAVPVAAQQSAMDLYLDWFGFAIYMISFLTLAYLTTHMKGGLLHSLAVMDVGYAALTLSFALPLIGFSGLVQKGMLILGAFVITIGITLFLNTIKNVK